MRTLDHMDKFLAVRVMINNHTVSRTPISNPFHTTRVEHSWSFWEWLKLGITRKFAVTVSIDSAPLAHARWFEGVDLCEQCQRFPIEKERSLCSYCEQGVEHPGLQADDFDKKQEAGDE